MKRAVCFLFSALMLLLCACAAFTEETVEPAIPSGSPAEPGPQEAGPSLLSDEENAGNPVECSFRMETVFDNREKEYYLYMPPTGCRGKALLLFDPDTNRDTGGNAALLDMDTGELERLPYMTENIRMDGEYFYWLASRLKPEGGAYGQVCRAGQSAPEEAEVLYETPEEWIQDSSLFYGDGFLVWGEYKVSEGSGDIERYRIMAFDLENGEPFEVDTIKDYYGMGLFLSVNSGMIAYGSGPVYCYSLKDRRAVAEQPCGAVKSAAYDGTYLAYVEETGDERLILTVPGTAMRRELAHRAVNADIVKGEFVVYSTDEGVFVYSISKDRTVFSPKPLSDEEGFHPGVWFHTNHETGTVLFKNIIKGNSENGPATTVSALFMDFAADR